MLDGDFPAGTRPWSCFARESRVWAASTHPSHRQPPVVGTWAVRSLAAKHQQFRGPAEVRPPTASAPSRELAADCGGGLRFTVR